jgi:hypothetical protein
MKVQNERTHCGHHALLSSDRELADDEIPVVVAVAVHAGPDSDDGITRMALSSRRHLEEDSKTSVAELPPEMLQHICSLLQDPDDVASCHLVDSRCAHNVEHASSITCWHSACCLFGPSEHVASFGQVC